MTGRMINAPTSNEIKSGIRKSRLQLKEVYFWTDTIKDWRILLSDDLYKEIIIECWQELVERRKITIYGFVIMPNHLHVIWEMMEKNGKEMPHASFNKFTSHQFLKNLQLGTPSWVMPYKVEDDPERKHRFWQRDPLAIKMFSRKVVEQKLEYIHLNPLQEKWNLTIRPENYRWSSARFYETGEDEFKMITHYTDRF
jgi:REP element-mobilizing transposase RayT